MLQDCSSCKIPLWVVPYAYLLSAHLLARVVECPILTAQLPCYTFDSLVSLLMHPKKQSNTIDDSKFSRKRRRRLQSGTGMNSKYKEWKHGIAALERLRTSMVFGLVAICWLGALMPFGSTIRAARDYGVLPINILRSHVAVLFQASENILT